MARLVSNPINRDEKRVSKTSPNKIDEIQASIMRGELLRYSLYIKDVKENLDNLKQSNIKYLGLVLKIIQVSITSLQGLDIVVPLKVLLSQVNEASYYNQEALDFTQEVLDSVDILTAKYYLAHLAAGILNNKNLKQQFKATIPFVKYIVNSLSKDSNNLQRQKEFMNAVKILINEKADSQKIAILPKLKYLADTNFDDNYELNVVDVVYGKESVEDLLNQYNAHKVSHRIQNSL